MKTYTLSPVFPGIALREQLESGGIELGLDPTSRYSAVYFWLRKASPPTRSIANCNEFIDWAVQTLNKTSGVVSGELGHLGHVSFELGRTSLSPKKIASLREIWVQHSERKAMQQLLIQLDYSIALYVGETSDLVQRIGDHLRGNTGFSKRLMDYGFSWEEVALRFFLLPPEFDAPHREAIERLVATSLLAPATSRAG